MVGAHMISIGSLAKCSGMRQRLLRYVLDQHLLTGVRLKIIDARGTRAMDRYTAFATLLAAKMLDIGCPRRVVRGTLGALCHTKGNRNFSLATIIDGDATALRIGDMRNACIGVQWYTLDGQLLPRGYKPDVELCFYLASYRQLLEKAGECELRGERDLC